MTQILGKFTKQPGDTLDYDIDYEPWFEGRSDAPASIQVTADPGITIVTSSRTGSVVKVVLSGGMSGEKYKITVVLTTTAATPLVKEIDFIVAVKAV